MLGLDMLMSTARLVATRQDECAVRATILTGIDRHWGNSEARLNRDMENTPTPHMHALKHTIALHQPANLSL